MRMVNMKDYERQAQLSVVLAVLAAAACLVAVYFIGKNFHFDTFETFYTTKRGIGFFAILGGVGAAMAAGVVGAFFAFNSAGQRRNKKSGLSWLGFFLNAGVLALALSAFVFFWLTKYNVG